MTVSYSIINGLLNEVDEARKAKVKREWFSTFNVLLWDRDNSKAL